MNTELTSKLKINTKIIFMSFLYKVKGLSSYRCPVEIKGSPPLNPSENVTEQ